MYLPLCGIIYLYIYVCIYNNATCGEHLKMPETINPYEKTIDKNNLHELKIYEESTESFTISSEEAAQILGVNRSRLSQLTGKGALAFERRKIDTRNRLFYKLSDLLSHQRSQFQGNFANQNINPIEKNQIHDKQYFEIQENNQNNFEDIEKTFKRNSFVNKTVSKKSLALAKDIHLNEIKESESNNIQENIANIKANIISQADLIKKIKQQSIKQENTLIN